MTRLFREPITMILIVACLLLVTPNASPQRKRQRSKPTIEDLLAAGTVEGPEDEILFHESYFQRLRRLPGWRIAVATDGDSQNRNTVAYYDPSRITRKRSNARTWVKYVEKENGVEYGHALMFQEYDCRSEMSRILESTNYDKEGKVLSIKTRSGLWSRNVPDSIGEEIYNVICKGGADAQEQVLREADECFRYARQEEKQGKFESSRAWYEDALTFAPGNAKILAALERISRKEKSR